MACRGQAMDLDTKRGRQPGTDCVCLLSYAGCTPPGTPESALDAVARALW